MIDKATSLNLYQSAIILGVTVILNAWSLTASAQNLELSDEYIITPESDFKFLNSQLPSPEELLPNTSPTYNDQQLGVVEQFRFVGNTVFSDEELTDVVEEYIGKPVTFNQLLQARRQITQLYVDSGYITSGAYIPPQEIEDNTVTIAIVEGSIDQINVEGTGRLDPDYVRTRLQLATEPPVNIPRLIDALQLLQLNPLIDQIQAELSASTQPGVSTLDVTFQTADTFDFSVYLDNGRSPSVSTFRQESRIYEGNLFGYGDSFDFTYSNTEGSDVFDVGYTIPINARDGSLNLFYSTRSSGIVEPPFKDLNEDGRGPDIESESRVYEVSLTQPLIRTPERELAIGLVVSRSESETSLLDDPVPLSLGADNEGKIRLTSLRFVQEGSWRNETSVLAARSQFSVGIDAFGITENEDAPDGHFFTWRGQAQWVKLLATDTIFLTRADVQIADRALLTQEQIGLGGNNNVRGYRQDALLVDNGVFATMEVRLPVYRNPQADLLLQLVPFVDFGVGWNHEPREELEQDTLLSAGIGLQLQYTEVLSIRVDWGIPIIEIESRDRTLQEQGIHFSVLYTLF